MYLKLATCKYRVEGYLEDTCTYDGETYNFDDPDNAERIAEARQRLAIAAQLYKARKKAGLSQAELARRMKVSQPMVAKLERGRGNISCGTLMKFAAACGCVLSITIS